MLLKNIGWTMMIAGFVLILFGCQSAPSSPMQFGPGGPPVLPKEARPISDSDSNTWQGREVLVDYSYVMAPAGMNLSGTVRFADKMSMLYSQLQSFSLSLIFFDAQGVVITGTTVASNSGDFSPFTFRTTVAVPSGAAAIAFGYQGMAQPSDPGDGGNIQFYSYPQ